MIIRRQVRNAGTSYKPLRYELTILLIDGRYQAEIRWIDIPGQTGPNKERRAQAYRVQGA